MSWRSSQHAREGRLGLLRILAVGQAVMAAGEPGILVDDAAQPFAELVIGALPQARKARADETMG